MVGEQNKAGRKTFGSPTWRSSILIVPAARSDQHFHSIVDAVIGLVTLDPAYKDGKYTENPVEGINVGQEDVRLAYLAHAPLEQPCGDF
jgi:hypothetical protein